MWLITIRQRSNRSSATMEKLRGKKVFIEAQDESYWLDKEDYDKLKEWTKKREFEFGKGWLTLTKK